MRYEDYVSNDAQPVQPPPIDNDTWMTRLGGRVNQLEKAGNGASESLMDKVFSKETLTTAAEAIAVIGAVCVFSRLGGGRLLSKAAQGARGAAAELAEEAAAKRAYQAAATRGGAAGVGPAPSLEELRRFQRFTANVGKEGAATGAGGGRAAVSDAPIPQYRRGRLVEENHIPNDFMFGESSHKPFGFRGLFKDAVPHRNPGRDSITQAMTRPLRDGEL